MTKSLPIIKVLLNGYVAIAMAYCFYALSHSYASTSVLFSPTLKTLFIVVILGALYFLPDKFADEPMVQYALKGIGIIGISAIIFLTQLF